MAYAHACKPARSSRASLSRRHYYANRSASAPMPSINNPLNATLNGDAAYMPRAFQRSTTSVRRFVRMSDVAAMRWRYRRDFSESEICNVFPIASDHHKYYLRRHVIARIRTSGVRRLNFKSTFKFPQKCSYYSPIYSKNKNEKSQNREILSFQFLDLKVWNLE